MTGRMEDDQNQLLEMQKSLMVAALNYQILYGPGSIEWNVTLRFGQKVNP